MNLSILNSLQKRLKDKPPESIQELHIDDFPLSQFPEDLIQEIEKCKNLLIFSANNCQLESLSRLPVLPKLLRIELEGNALPLDSLISLFIYKNSLVSLSLAGNPFITDVEDIDFLAEECPLLRQIDLYGCPIADKGDYREKIFKKFKRLEYLDSLGEKGQEIILDLREEKEEYNKQIDGSQPKKKIKKK